MKKLSLLLVFSFVALLLNAQIVDKKYLGEPSDTLTTGSTVSQIIEMKGDIPYTYTVMVHHDSISGQPNYTASLLYSVGGAYYVPVKLNDSTDYSVVHTSGVDTTFTFEGIGEQFEGTHLKVLLTATDTVQNSRVSMYIKNWYKNKY